MGPVVSIVGTSGCGKTTLICKLLPLFAERGYRVAVIKHHDGDFAIDHEGKDTYRFAATGAPTVMISSPGKTAIVRRNAAAEDRSLAAGSARRNVRLLR
jgi:molybdopterin-guanine dinucleotide biosynthesis protein MobB